jgi:2-oxoglutarate dehydrogenase E1 component
MDLDFGVNAGFIEELYDRYLENPESVDDGWRAFFDERHPGGRVALLPPEPDPEVAPRSARAPDMSGLDATAPTLHSLQLETAGPISIGPITIPRTSLLVMAQAAVQARVYKLITAYRDRGHAFAALDPLGGAPPAERELAIEAFGFTEADLDRVVPTVDLPGPPEQTLREVVARLRETYCRSIGAEFSQVEDPEQRAWLQDRLESTQNRLLLSRQEKVSILTKLSEAEIFEQFVHKSWPGAKRFSLEGAESLIPLLDLIVERSSAEGVDEIVIGMPHRGRLNVLANILDKSPRELFASFEDSDPERYLGGGDVKYHLGYSTDRKTQSGRKIHVTLTFNPSHLEFVDPVVEGRTRAKQDRFGDVARVRALALLIHGDAAFIGQGVVAETCNLAKLEGYTTGGTIHVVVNNQVGFTTNPNEARTPRHCTALCEMLRVPIFHVNGEDPEAVVQVAHLAVDFRQRFHQDVVIDVFCYRRYGHNEGDEPRFTQPAMYAVIDEKPTIRQIYVERLAAMGHVTEALAEEIAQNCRHELVSALDEIRKRGFEPVSYTGGGLWTPYRGGPERHVPEVDTQFPTEKLVELSRVLATLPEGFRPHPSAREFIHERHRRIVSGGSVDWRTAELLAYATLLSERVPVRISGQDVCRGTFSQRHAVLYDQVTNAPYVALAHLFRDQESFTIVNSPASGAGVLGFEFGYSLDYPEALVVWEAQYGDFLNTAQVIVDQFITSSEDKWHRLSGLVLYLPHGHEGEGPEQSSARIERFLQNSAEDNVQVVHPTTPAQLFHVLRRQAHRRWRKPLVLFTPNTLRRVTGDKREISVLADLASGRFRRVIGDDTTEPAAVTKILLCSGKVYFDLVRRRDDRRRTDVAIVRLEQLYPLHQELIDALAPYPDETPLVWVQEEPRNYGCWYWVRANLSDALGGRFPISVAARRPSGSPATGSRASHLLEQEMLLDEAFA